MRSVRGFEQVGGDFVDTLGEGLQQALVLGLQPVNLRLEVGDPATQPCGFLNMCGRGTTNETDKGLGHEDPPQCQMAGIGGNRGENVVPRLSVSHRRQSPVNSLPPPDPGLVYPRRVDLFAAPDQPWQRVSPRLAALRRLIAVPGPLVVGLALGAFAALDTVPGWVRVITAALGVIALALAAWLWRWAGRNAASWGYVEAADDLLVTGGVLFRRLVAVPYGRMQFVEVAAGPLERHFGIAKVSLHTASTETAATIPGLPQDEAARLRNRLTEHGESRGAGL